ncbi:MAG: methyltransferase [Lentisphaerae bacterium RIFOXYB12_FULL_65_16]|nr:MAG: methyltransferase [Lentisphaerae bacterium RIFOXYA12_64_32]OGV85537.1 MAG: methyltransferase [Lentisphaerae bacterium RIFOXYB12_FULL_65_16]
MNITQQHDLPLGHLQACQVCGCSDLQLVIDLGHHAPCDSLLRENQLHEIERTYPLRCMRCPECGLVQIDYVVAPEELFYQDYPYRSGITSTLARNLQSIAQVMIESEHVKLPKGSFVVDLGSNDGTLLQGFKSAGMRVLGVEPTKIAAIANANGIPSLKTFFGTTVGRQIREQYGQAQVVTAANMFAHVAKLSDLIRGVAELLCDGGIFLTESHYLLDLLKTVQYDSIYHEHLKYYSLKPFVRMLDAYGFSVIDAERIPNYGGSIRVFAKKAKGLLPSLRMKELLAEEEYEDLYGPRPFEEFRNRVAKSKTDLQNLLVDLRRNGKTVVGVGCPGRCATLLNYCRVDRDLMPYIAEQPSCLKVGMFLPGAHIPVVDEKIMFESNPDYAVILSWHYWEPIVRNLRAKGITSKFIVPLPEVHVLED